MIRIGGDANILNYLKMLVRQGDHCNRIVKHFVALRKAFAKEFYEDNDAERERLLDALWDSSLIEFEKQVSNEDTPLARENKVLREAFKEHIKITNAKLHKLQGVVKEFSRPNKGYTLTKILAEYRLRQKRAAEVCKEMED